jgi:hypothetical protein
MHMGHYAAMNIHEHMLAECTGQKANFQTLGPFPSVMGLAIGKKAVSYTPDEGTRDGEELQKSLFGKDMGHTSTLPPVKVNLLELTMSQSVGTTCVLARR